MSSLGRTTTRAVSPCRRALRLERFLPWSDVGPWDRSAFWRLAAYCAGDGMAVVILRCGFNTLEMGWGVKALILLVKLVANGKRLPGRRRAGPSNENIASAWR